MTLFEAYCMMALLFIPLYGFVIYGIMEEIKDYKERKNRSA